VSPVQRDPLLSIAQDEEAALAVLADCVIPNYPRTARPMRMFKVHNLAAGKRWTAVRCPKAVRALVDELALDFLA
jgi:hypothetical protein